MDVLCAQADKAQVSNNKKDDGEFAASVRETLSRIPSGLLRQCLTHKSAVPARSLSSNERLEFLGDAVLSLVIAEELYTLFPDRSEGELARARSLVVCKTALTRAGKELGIRRKLILGATEEAMGGRERSSLIADAFEAIIAAIYLTLGTSVVRGFILEMLSVEMTEVSGGRDWRDPKTILQEYCQSVHLNRPVYRVVAEEGRPHDRTYSVEVWVHDEKRGFGSGKSKKEAEQIAAMDAISQGLS